MSLEHSYVLNSGKRKIHIVLQGALRALCGWDPAAAPSTPVTAPVLERRTWRGKPCHPCGSCRGLAAAKGLFEEAARRRKEDDGSGTSSSESCESSGPE